MGKKRKILFVSINAFLVIVGLYFGLPTSFVNISADKHSPEEIRRRVESTTDVQKLRALIMADIDYLGSARDLAVQFREATLAGSAVAVLAGVVNILFLTMSGRKQEVAAGAEAAQQPI
jgi:hypothetical protein